MIVPSWRMVVFTSLLFVLASLTSLSGLGCASTPKFPRSASTGALDRVLGGPPEIVVTGHVADALKDPLWESSKAAFFFSRTLTVSRARPKPSARSLRSIGSSARTPTQVGPPPTAGEMTELAAVAKRLFDSERWNDAVRAFGPIVDGTTGDDEGNRQLAHYHRGIALFKLRRFPESAAIFREIAGSPRHLKHNETLLWLVQLSASNPDELRITDFAKYRTEDEAIRQRKPTGCVFRGVVPRRSPSARDGRQQ
jgi:hypothetical protein